MPFKSEKQRRYLHANHPEIAKRWERDYAHGGILDINESEEIIDDGGNEIELTDYNAAFDDPNDLSTGVKSLFRAKDGGRIGFYRGSDRHSGTSSSSGPSGPPGGGATSMGSGRDYSAPSSSGNQGSVGGGDQEDDVAKMEKDMGVTTDHSPDYTGSDYGFVTSEDEETEIGGADYMGPQDKVRIQNDILNRKKKFDSGWEKTKRVGSTVWSFMNITNPLGAAKFVYDQNKKKNERIAEIEYDLSLLDKIGAPKFSPHTDTLYQTLEQEKLDLLQPKTRDTPDEGPDGPDLPEVVPIGEEIQEYASIGPDAGRTLASIRSKQALNAQLQAKWAAEQEAYDQSFMLANKGGLANLFRVKKQ